MSLLFWLLGGGVYMACWLAAAIVAARLLASTGRGKCHAEGWVPSPWSNRSLCRQHCKPGCWRSDSLRGLSAEVAVYASLLAMIWPLLVLPAVVYTLAMRTLTPAADLAAIERMERELGIGDQP